MPVSLSVGVPNGSLPAHAATRAPRAPWVYSIDVRAVIRIARMTVKHEPAAGKPNSANVW